MSSRGTQVLEDALSLPPAERAELADRLMSSLDPPSQGRMDLLWGEEVEERLEAFDRGEIRAVPAKQVFESVDKKPR